MSKFCVNCGKELEENINTCPNCGAKVNNENATIINNVNVNQTTPITTKREIVLAVILSIITCGIYGLYWFACLTNDANKVSGENTPSGGMAILLTLVTCGIYSFYWNYKMGQKLYNAGKMHNKEINDNSVIYLICSLVGFSIVSYCLIQNDLNKFSE